LRDLRSRAGIARCSGEADYLETPTRETRFWTSAITQGEETILLKFHGNLGVATRFDVNGRGVRTIVLV
jgi:hypothetical protein